MPTGNIDLNYFFFIVSFLSFYTFLLVSRREDFSFSNSFTNDVAVLSLIAMVLKENIFTEISKMSAIILSPMNYRCINTHHHFYFTCLHTALICTILCQCENSVPDSEKRKLLINTLQYLQSKCVVVCNVSLLLYKTNDKAFVYLRICLRYFANGLCSIDLCNAIDIN